MLGRSFWFCCCWVEANPVKIQCNPAIWSDVSCVRLRKIATLSIARPSLGISSETEIPGITVDIALTSVRYPVGASGLGSSVSMCDGPPLSTTWMTALLDGDFPDWAAATARARSRSGNVKPPKPNAPTRRKLRRLKPSQEP